MSLLSKSVEEESEPKLKIAPSPSVLDSTNDQFDKFLLNLKHDSGTSHNTRFRPTIIPSNSLQSLPEHGIAEVNKNKLKGKEKIPENSTFEEKHVKKEEKPSNNNKNSNRHGLRHYSSSNLAAMAAAIRSNKLSSVQPSKNSNLSNVNNNNNNNINSSNSTVRHSNSLSTSLDQINCAAQKLNPHSVAEINVDNENEEEDENQLTVVLARRPNNNNKLDPSQMSSSHGITRSNSDKSVFKKNSFSSAS